MTRSSWRKATRLALAISPRPRGTATTRSSGWPTPSAPRAGSTPTGGELRDGRSAHAHREQRAQPGRDVGEANAHAVPGAQHRVARLRPHHLARPGELLVAVEHVAGQLGAGGEEG